MKVAYFVRHGESEANAAKIIAGAPSPLTELGRRQAKEVAVKLVELCGRVDLIIASPFVRTKQTAEIMAAELHYPLERIEYDDRIVETYNGKFYGQALTDGSREQLMNSMLDKNNPMEVEWIGDLTARLSAFWADLGKRPEDTIAIVGHNASGRMLRRIAAGLDYTEPINRLQNVEIAQLYPTVEIKQTDDMVL
jgi:broad specificity phosphatase PhoE